VKAGLDKSQLMGVAGGAAAVLVAGGVAWFGLGGLGEKQAEAQALTERMGNPALAALLNDPGGGSRASRDAAEIQKLAKELQAGDSFANQWAQAAQELGGDGQDWAKDPGKWKDRLIAIQSQLQKEAKAGRLGLAPDFYLGLDGYRQKSPTPEEVPGLALHLSVAERLVRRLMEARQTKEQYPTVCEFRSLGGPGSVQEKGAQEKPPPPPGPGGGKPGGPVAEAERKPFRVEIRSSPEVLYEYISLLVADPALFIVTDLRLANEKQTFPLRSEIAKKFSEAPAPASGDQSAEKKEKKKLLEILAGEEALNTTLMIDFVAWKKPEEAKAAGTPPPAGTP
jgi:hypothetical protein